MPKSTSTARTVRRSVALPRQLVEQAQAAAPGEIRGNVNRIVIVALQEFLERRRREQFETEMARMALDPSIQAECRRIASDFAAAEFVGLRPPRPSRAFRKHR